MVKQAIAVTGKPVVASEYAKESRSAAAKALGDAACLAGAIGTGNGRSITPCGQRPQKKKRWYKEYENELIVSGVAALTLYAVSRYGIPMTLQANEDTYKVGIEAKGFGLSYSENEVLATYRFEF